MLSADVASGRGVPYSNPNKWYSNRGHIYECAPAQRHENYAMTSFSPEVDTESSHYDDAREKMMNYLIKNNLTNVRAISEEEFHEFRMNGVIPSWKS